MKGISIPTVPEDIQERIRLLRDTGATAQRVILAMREEGLPIYQCIRMYQRMYDVSLTDAKITVHTSDAWADIRKVHDHLHEELADALKQPDVLRKLEGTEKHPAA